MIKFLRSGMLLTFFLFIGTVTCNAATISAGYGFTTDSYLDKFKSLPVVRPINGGTVFKVTYDNTISKEVQGAFEYACKIMSENLPPSLPITVRVETGYLPSKRGKRAFSKVAVPLYEDFGEGGYGYSTDPMRIKSVILLEYDLSNNQRFIDSIPNLSFFDNPSLPDITITYNRNSLNDCSFSIDEKLENKYDFVTIALRDLARGLGFRCGLYRDTDTTDGLSLGRKPTLYESDIWSRLTENGQSPYENATKGSLSTYVGNLYAPEKWVDGVSLNYFYPDSMNPLTELLQYEFGKGCLIRNISDSNLGYIFSTHLGWFASGTSGSGSSTHYDGTTSNVMPYKGNITIGRAKGASDIQNDGATTLTASNSTPKHYSIDIREFCKPYHLYNDGDSGSGEGWRISALKKDGTWDCIGYDLGDNDNLNISYEDIQFHYPDSVYYRTCDGHLRIRASLCVPRHPTYSYSAHYFAMDYTPQAVDLSYDGINDFGISLASFDNNLVDVKICIKNLEGITRLVVEQLDEGRRVPARFDVDDFKKGYFYATVDKTGWTEFSIISYNNNGATRSKTIRIKPAISLRPDPDPDPGIVVTQNEIRIESVCSEASEPRTLSGNYAIHQIGAIRSTELQNGTVDFYNPQIDISHLTAGLYVFVLDIGGYRFTRKFSKI